MTRASTTIVVAFRGFTEEQISGYLYADLLTHHGFHVDTSHVFGSPEGPIITALEHNQVDLIPDYIGNGLTVDLNKPYKVGTSAAAVWHQVDNAFNMKYKIRWLKPAFKFNDQNVFVTKR